MKSSKVTFQDNNRSRTVDDTHSLGNTHFSFIQTSSFVELRDGSLKRRRQKLNYKDIYLEHQDYKQISVRNNSTKLFSNTFEPNCSSLRSSLVKNSNIKRKSKEQEDIENVSIDEMNNQKSNFNKNNMKSIQKISTNPTNKMDILSIKTKQEREYKRRREKERNEDEYLNSNKLAKFSKRTLSHMIQNDDDNNIDGSKLLQSSTKKVGTKYQERVQYINFNDFLNKEEVKSTRNIMKEDNKNEIDKASNRRHNQNDKYEYQQSKLINNQQKGDYDNNGNNDGTQCLRQSNPNKKSIHTINIIPTSINENNCQQINNNLISGDEVNLKTNSKKGLNAKKAVISKENTINVNKENHLMRNKKMVNKNNSLQKQLSSSSSNIQKENFNSKWQRAIENNHIVRNNSKDFFNYVYKSKGNINSALVNNSHSTNQSNLIQQFNNKEEIKDDNYCSIQAKENNKELISHQNRLNDHHGVLKNFHSNIKKNQSKDDIDDIKLINMMKTSNIDNERLTGDKANTYNPSSKLINYSQFLNKKPLVNNYKVYRPASALNIQQLKDNSMDLNNDKEQEGNDCPLFKTNLKFGNKNISTIQKDKEGNDDSEVHDRKNSKKPADSLGDLLMEGKGCINNCKEQYNYHRTPNKNTRDNDNIKKDYSNNQNGFMSINKYNKNNPIDIDKEKENQMSFNRQPRTARICSNDIITNISHYNNVISSKVNNELKTSRISQIKSSTTMNSNLNYEDNIKNNNLLSNKNFNLLKHNNRVKPNIYNQIEDRIVIDGLTNDNKPIVKRHPRDCLNLKTLKHLSKDETLFSKGYQSFPINPYYNNDKFNVTSSTIFDQQLNKNSNGGKDKVLSLARSLSQGSLLSITDQFILNNRISLSPHSTLRKDLLRSTFTRQNSTFYINKLKEDLREYASSKEKSLKKKHKTKEEYIQIQTKRMLSRGIMPPNDINEIEYFYF